MIRISLLLNIFIFTTLVNSNAVNSLRIIDPMNPWYDLPSKISDADLTFHPKGTFVEVGMYLTFTQFESGLDSSIQLEVIYNFDLPVNAIVTDSWLWIEGIPEKALILDRWTASAIYESIVERRMDPSILSKVSPTSYELRIYPLTTNMPRKVKITYLLPVNWSSSQVSVPIPLKMLRVGWEYPEQVNVYTQTDSTWQNPTLKSDSVSEFTPYSGNEYPVNSEALISISENNYSLDFDSPMEGGLFINQYNDGNTGYYQLALLPSELLNVDKPKKICFLIDYGGSQGKLSGILENSIRNNMMATDSFNIIISGIELSMAGEQWLPANDSTITSVFESLGDLSNSYSVLPMLVAEGMKYAGNEGTLVLISDDNSIGTFDKANQLIGDLAAYKPWPVIHVLDLNYIYRIWMGGRYYYGNEYFFGLLTRQTNGNYISLRNGEGISQNLDGLVQSAGGFISSFDLYTALEQGFCYSRYNTGLSGSTAYLNRPIQQVGRYNGNFPFKLILSGVCDDISFSEEITVEADKIYPSDTVAKQIWSGMYIQSLQKSAATNEIIGEIINVSMENRILSDYTSFLTLEPGMVPEINEEDEFGNEIVFTNEKELPVFKEVSLSGNPNPFSSEITFTLQISEDNFDESASLRIYNLSGQLIRILDLQYYPERDVITILWDGRNDSGAEISKGIYIVKYRSKDVTKTIRIVKIQ